MPDPTRQPDERLERYLDGVSSDAERRVVEAWLAGDPSGRAEAELQQRIDRSLCVAFEPPRCFELSVVDERSNAAVNVAASNGALRLTSEVDASARPGRPSRWRRPLAVAAAIALAAAGLWLATTSGSRRATTSPYGEHRSLASFYAETVASGFEPQWVCADDAEFRRTFETHYRQPLMLRGESESVRMLGLSYVYSLSSRTTVMLARADGAPVMVFIDRIERDPGPEHLEHDGLNLFRRRLGGVVMYELTPNEQPYLLDRFHAAEEDTS